MMPFTNEQTVAIRAKLSAKHVKGTSKISPFSGVVDLESG